MPAHKIENDREFALFGAAAKVRELRSEIDAIYRRFPELKRRDFDQTSLGTPSSGKPRRAFSTKGKRAISQGMKKWWAQRKAAQATSGKSVRAARN